jgi:dolichol-phosphate mannosyltransferase
MKSQLADVSTNFIFVNDGSRDNSFEILRAASADNSSVKVISFSRNFGHQAAITAGIKASNGDWVAIIDGDLQDPPELIGDMLLLAESGYDVVYGQRKSRAGETWFKKFTAASFYKLLSHLCEIPIPRDTGDFRLMSRRAVDAFNSLNEKHRFVRGMVPWIGFPSIALKYDRSARFAGETKYPLKKMVSFAFNAILSFSSKPLTIAIRLGLIIIFLAVLWAIYAVYVRFFSHEALPGFTAILVAITFFSGVQIFLIGIVGEYIGKIFEEVKGRPIYVISETINI